MAGLAGQVEQVVLALHQVPHGRFITNVGNIQPDAIFDAGNVVQVASGLRRQVVNQQHLGIKVNQASREVRADKPQAPRHQHAAACVGIAQDIGLSVSRALVQ